MVEFKLGKSGKQFLIKGATAYWAKVQKPVPKHKAKNGEMQYEIKVFVTEAIVDQMDAASLNKAPPSIADKNKKSMKKKGEVAYPVEFDDMFELSLASSSTWADGKPKDLAVVKDNKPFKDNIGNGSIVDVIGYIGKQNDEGLHTVYLDKVKVVTLVEYEGDADFDFDISGDEDDFGGVDDDDDTPF